MIITILIIIAIFFNIAIFSRFRPILLILILLLI